MVILQNIIDVASLGGLYALVALGIGLVFGIMRLINFAHGELIMVGGYSLLVFAFLPEPLVIVLTISVVILLALGMERIAFRPVRQASLPTLLITSFAVSFFLQNVAMLIFGSRAKGVNFAPGLSQQIMFDGVRLPLLPLVTAGATVVLLVALALFLKRTKYGVQMRAAAENVRMARLMGVQGNRVIAIAFGASGLLAAVVSLLYIAQIGALTPTVGLNPAIIGFIATVVGGLGSLLGAAIGGFVIGATTLVLEITLPPDLRVYREAFLFGILLIVLLFRPQGIVVVRWARERV